MSRIFAITNQKGGVGKTTTAVNLSASMANMGRKVLLIDFDPQGNTTSGLGLRAGKKSIYEALLLDFNIKECLVQTMIPKLHLIPADIRLAGAEIELAPLDNREFKLKKIIDSIESNYDDIFIDCPPSLSLLTINALVAAKSVLVPIQCEYYALEGVTSLMQTINRVKKAYNPQLDIEGILLTMFDGRTNLSIQVVESVKKHFKSKVFSVAIPRNVRLGEAPSHGLPIHLYDNRSLGAEAYNTLAKELIARAKK
ncbi:MAG: ParA family protein [Christensenellaceae bacterium]|nr:ParA family protein [Christensenellaceae bacterium]